jgi:dTDP-4-amino-4,6-dideoxygalactose transaminase
MTACHGMSKPCAGVKTDRLVKTRAILAHRNRPTSHPVPVSFLEHGSRRATAAIMIPFNRPSHIGNELGYIKQAIRSGHISGNGEFSRKCSALVKRKFDFAEVFLTPSCTSALEMAALLCDFQAGDEVILPSFTHVGTANAFARAGARIVLADSLDGHPNVDPDAVGDLIGPRTKAIVAVHYAGMACAMEKLQQLAQAHGLFLIEDAAHALGARYRGKNLGSWSDFAAFSFHETKNITCGLGGMLVVNRLDSVERARRIWNHGTNRQEFEDRRIPFYTWIETGGGFQLSDLNAAYLYAQLLRCDQITGRRLSLWQTYYEHLLPLQRRGYFRLPVTPEGAQHNGHIFYLLAENSWLRDQLIEHLGRQGYQAVFHYIPLHASPRMLQNEGVCHLPRCAAVADTIVRLPLFDSLSRECVIEIVLAIEQWVDFLTGAALRFGG